MLFGFVFLCQCVRAQNQLLKEDESKKKLYFRRVNGVICDVEECSMTKFNVVRVKLVV